MVANQCSEPEIPVDTLVVFMRGVLRCESALRELNLMWRLIESSAKMNCPQEARALLPMLQATREGLQCLEVDLVQPLRTHRRRGFFGHGCTVVRLRGRAQ